MLIYESTSRFSQQEWHGLADQMRRAAISIPSNIAEGFTRSFPKEKRQFLNIANGSRAELETQIEIAKELNFIDTDSYRKILDLIEETGRMLNTVIWKTQHSDPNT